MSTKRVAGPSRSMIRSGTRSGRARIQLALGNSSGALQCSDEAVARCARHEVIRSLVRSRALKSHDESVAQAAAAAELASVCGLVQTVASEGAECVRLMELAAWRVPLGVAGSGSTRGVGRGRCAPGVSWPGRDTDGSGARSSPTAAQPAHSERNCRRAVHIDEHAQVPPEGDLSEARLQLEGRGSGRQPRHGAAAAHGVRRRRPCVAESRTRSRTRVPAPPARPPPEAAPQGRQSEQCSTCRRCLLTAAVARGRDAGHVTSKPGSLPRPSLPGGEELLFRPRPSPSGGRTRPG